MMRKRFLALIVWFCLIAGVFAAFPMRTMAAGTGVADKLNQLRSRFPDGWYWNHRVDTAADLGSNMWHSGDRNYEEKYQNTVSQTPCYTHNGNPPVGQGRYDCSVFDGGMQCYGFANKLFYEVFGVRCTESAITYNVNQVRVGDHVRFADPNDRSFGHSFVVLEKNGSKVKVAECNWLGGCRIGWGREVDLNGSMRVYGRNGGWAYLTFYFAYQASNYDEVNNSGAGNVSFVHLGNDFYAYIKSELGSLNVENTGVGAVTEAYPDVRTGTADPYEPRQIWHFIWDSGREAYKIVNLYDGRCLDVQGGAAQSETNIGVSEDNGSEAQRWRLMSVGRDGEKVFSLLPAGNSGVSMDVFGEWTEPGTNVFLHTRHGAVNQLFQIRTISDIGGVLSASARSRLGDDFYAQISYNGAYVCTTGIVTGQVEYGEPRMDVRAAGTSDVTDPKQIWHFIWGDYGFYKIVNEYSGWCLDVLGGKAGNEKDIQTWYKDYAGNADGWAQRWSLIYQPEEDTYRLASAIGYPWGGNGSHGLYCMDSPGGILEEGTNIQLYGQNYGPGQRFTITPVSYERPAVPSAPQNVRVDVGLDKVTVAWDEVPALSRYDNRIYELYIFSQNLNEYVSLSGNSYTSEEALPLGEYAVRVRAVNTKYPSWRSGYGQTSFSVTTPRNIIVTAVAGGVAEGGGSYRDGESVTVTAVPDGGFEFKGWSENGVIVSADSGYTFTVNGERILVAVFEKKPEPTAAPTPEPTPAIAPTPIPAKPTAAPEPTVTETPTPKPNPAEPPSSTAEPSVYDGWRNEAGLDYWYENGIKQGTEGRGKEIYDPAGDAWYWLDAVQGGAKAVGKDVYQESSGGKWVRYNENGEMVKGEDYRYGGWYYFEPVTGAMMKGPVILADGRKVFYDTVNGQMLKGWQNINGQDYYFDENNGNLIEGPDTLFWVHIDGKDFWYENWQRQGWNPADESYRGKEIYDPASDAWYWLDNVLQGGRAVGKDVYQESYSAYPDREDGTGKWVRYDGDGHMVKGWQYTDAGVFYFEEITGAMAKGKVIIEDEEYYFDEITGIRQW